MRPKRAFTLVELLIVISIIAMLLAVLLPALSKAREQSRLLVCRTKEKTLVMAAKLWSNDNDDWVIAGDWFKAYGDNDRYESSLQKYYNAKIGETQTVLCCPSAANLNFPQARAEFAPKGGSKTFSYGVNGNLVFNMRLFDEGSPGTPGPSSGYMGSGQWGNLCGYDGKDYVFWDKHGVTKMSSIRIPSDTAYFIDHQYYAAFSWTMNPPGSLKAFNEHPDHQYYKHIALWHGSKDPYNIYGKGNIGWVDGHVSIEPYDFKSKETATANPKTGAKNLTKTFPRWTYYYWNH